MPPLNASSFSKNTNPTIHNVFPELNQGKRYLQKQTEVEKKINNTRNFIESFTPYNKRGQLKKCSAVGQASANKHVPCACGNAMCTTSTPYCNYQLGACFSTPTNQNQAKEDWDVNSNCSGDGQFSSCKAKAGCASYGYCAPPMKINPLVQWDNDRSRARDPNGGDLQLNSLMGQQTMTKADYMSNVQQYVNMPPPCNGDLANCQANPPYYGRNVTIPQQIGPAPYGPGYPHPACGLEVLGNPGDGGTEAVSRAQVESLDAACHAEPDCVGFGQKSGGGWDFLKWNANPAYLGPTDTQMKTPGNYPKYFYIQNPVTGCNSSKCCGIQGTPGNCKTDPYDPACYVPGGAPPVPNTPTPTAAPPPPPIAGGWSNWSTSCPPAPNNIQTRTCSAPPPAYGGADCSALDGGNGYRACNPPVNGGWSDWTTGCPPAPGNQQTRSCTAPSTAYGGTPCSGPSSRPCFSPSTFSPTPPPSSPTPSSAPVVNGIVVTYNGKQYRTITGLDPNGYCGDERSLAVAGCSCESNSAPKPSGWKIAEDTPDSRLVAKSYPWNTKYLVMKDGLAWYTSSYPESREDIALGSVNSVNSNWLCDGDSNMGKVCVLPPGQASTLFCDGAVLMEKDVAPTPAPPPSSLYPPPTFWPQPKEEYAYYNQGEALAACKKAGYAGLCNSASVIAKGGQCSAGYVSDSTRAGYYCPEGGCGSPAGCGGSQGGWRTWYPSGYHAGAYCCGVAGSTETCKGMDGRYDVGDPRRYTGGWSLEGGSPDAASCDALCYDQPECKVSGQTCNPIYYGYSKNCYCDFCVSK